MPADPPLAERRLDPIDFLRMVGTDRIEAIRRRLEAGHHEARFQDLLDEPPRLLRFELKPWPGPFHSGGPRRHAMLEIGAGAGSDGLVTAWYWMDGLDEAPHGTATVPSGELTAAWIEAVVLEFVRKALMRR